MKGLILAFSFVFMMPISYAIVIEQSENAIDNDLSFTLTDDSVKERNVASQDKDKKPQKPQVIPDSQQDDTDRDVANDEEKIDNKIQYWKY